jgi:hypothetical protein
LRYLAKDARQFERILSISILNKPPSNLARADLLGLFFTLVQKLSPALFNKAPGVINLIIQSEAT